MRTLLSLIALTCLMSARITGAEPDKNTRGQQLLFHIRVLEGDPLGSREAGTIKVLAEPTVVTLENRSFTVMVGAEVPVKTVDDSIEFVETGLRLEGKPGTVREDQIRLDFSMTETRLDDSVKQTETRAQFTSDGTRVISTIKLGEVARFRIGGKQENETSQRWVELTPEVVKPVETE